MATDSYKLGPGTLTFDKGGTDEIEVSAQVRNARVESTENVTEEEDMDLLDGSTLLGQDNVTRDYVLAGTVVQDLNAVAMTPKGFTDWTWQNRGEELDFEFVPNTARGATTAVTGTCRIVPLTIGGDVKVKNTADFSFAVVGAEPTFTPDSTP